MSWVGILLVIVGLLLALVAAAGLLRLQDVYLRLQAASVGAIGVTSILLASLGTGNGRIIVRALLVATFLVLASPVSSHAIARAAWLRREKLGSKGGWDETGTLADPPP
ncbi:MAG TPA: monovalent cation/H(+) antiporter subunit G [Vulgatibacter sp.]|nr:monovalent cation/H(+) antiporter subunit G [Vulgatibacter sp.]